MRRIPRDRALLWKWFRILKVIQRVTLQQVWTLTNYWQLGLSEIQLATARIIWRREWEQTVLLFRLCMTTIHFFCTHYTANLSCVSSQVVIVDCFVCWSGLIRHIICCRFSLMQIEIIDPSFLWLWQLAGFSCLGSEPAFPNTWLWKTQIGECYALTGFRAQLCAVNPSGSM